MGAGEDGQLVRLLMWSVVDDSTRREAESWSSAYLLHDASLALGEGDVTTRLVLNELDFDLPALAAGLVVVVVIVVGGIAGAGALGTSRLGVAIAVLEVVMLIVGRVGVVGDNLSRHVDDECSEVQESLCCFG